MPKKRLTIQEIDWANHLERIKRGFINRWQERRALRPKRKFNNRKLTCGRLRQRDFID